VLIIIGASLIAVTRRLIMIRPRLILIACSLIALTRGLIAALARELGAAGRTYENGVSLAAGWTRNSPRQSSCSSLRAQARLATTVAALSFHCTQPVRGSGLLRERAEEMLAPTHAAG
jgi:hypothetical protein